MLFPSGAESSSCHENHGICGGGPPEGCPGAVLGQKGLMDSGHKGEEDKGAAFKGQKWGEILWHTCSQLLPPGECGLTVQSLFGEYFVSARVKPPQTGTVQDTLCVYHSQIPTDSPGEPSKITHRFVTPHPLWCFLHHCYLCSLNLNFFQTCHQFN